MQSPKSKRPHGPGETSSSDGNSVSQSSGNVVGKQGPSGNNKGASGSAGPVFSDDTVRPVGPSASNQGGSPGSVDRTNSGSDQMRKGGNRSGTS